MNTASAAPVQFLLQPETATKLDRSFAARFLLVLTTSVILMLAACRSETGNSNNSSESASIVTSSIPPFATREPERYQAVRLITFSETASKSTNSVPDERASKVLIARDGEKRREEYLEGGEQIVYLEIPAGRFILLPASGLYADLNATPERTSRNEFPNEAAGLSTDLLVNEEHAATTYEKLGPETLEGRTTTKYRVTTGSTTPETAVKTETLIWIDETLGLPVRSETTSATSERSSKVVTELKDIRLDTEERLFALPMDYKKVEFQLILNRIRGYRPH